MSEDKRWQFELEDISDRVSQNRQRKVKHGRLRLVCSRWMG